MKIRPLVLSLLALGVLAACQKHESGQPAAEAAPSAEAQQAAAMPQRAPAPTVVHGSAFEVAVGGPETQQALPVPAGGQVEATATVATAGQMVGASVLVGNFFNSSTGPMAFEACIAERCASGSADAGLSVDNQPLDFALAEPLEVAAGDVVTYRFSRPEGANDIVLWTFAAATPTDHLAADAGRTPKTKLLFE